MSSTRTHDKTQRHVRAMKQAGVTLLEILVVIYITGVGLLALLRLFPLGALEMARAIKDDRTAEIAAKASALSAAGEDLLSRTAQFVTVSWSDGSADPKTAVKLRAEYEALAALVGELELQLRTLQIQLPRPIAQKHLARLLAEIRQIKKRIDTVVELLALLEAAVGVD